MKKKILIYDDEEKQTERFENILRQTLKKAGRDRDFAIKILCEDGLQDSIEKLQIRQERFRRNERCSNEITVFDNTSIFIIDYDLLDNKKVKFLTGEVIAYIVRCFSDCKLIVGLNQFGRNPFDLTLRGHPESFADLNLGADQLGNLDLWRGNWGDSRKGYRPWYWPNLSDSLRHFDRKVEEVRENLDEPIHKVLGFEVDMFQRLPRAVIQFIGTARGNEPAETTFRDFVIRSRNGLSYKDVPRLNDSILDDDVLARVGAARISKWLERLVLPEQDILVDAPHLVSRYPSLIHDEEKAIATWNRTAQLVAHDELGLTTDKIECYRLQKDYWVSRPVWVWDKLREDEGIKEVREPWLAAKPTCFFCEDASRFYKRRDCKEFFADVASPFARRLVKGFQKVDYRPRVRLWL